MVTREPRGSRLRWQVMGEAEQQALGWPTSGPQVCVLGVGAWVGGTGAPLVINMLPQ